MREAYREVESLWNIPIAGMTKRIQVPAEETIDELMIKSRVAFLVDTVVNPATQPAAVAMEDITGCLDLVVVVALKALPVIPPQVSMHMNALLWPLKNRMPQYAETVVRYLSEHPGDCQIFANLVYPSWFGYFVNRDQMEPACAFLEHVLRLEYSTVGGLMFSSLFNAFPSFLRTLFSTFFGLLGQNKASYHHGAFFALLTQSVAYAARYLCDQHRAVMALVIERYGDTDFLAEYFVKRVLLHGFERYSLHDLTSTCPISRQLVINDFREITESDETQIKVQLSLVLAKAVVEANMSLVTLPSLGKNTGKTPLLTSRREVDLVFRMFGKSNIPSAQGLGTLTLVPFVIDMCQVVSPITFHNKDCRLFTPVPDEFKGVPDEPDSQTRFMYLTLTREVPSPVIGRMLDTDQLIRIPRFEEPPTRAQVEYFMRRRITELASRVETLEGLIDLQLMNQVLDTQSEIWHEYYSMHIHQAACAITSSYSPVAGAGFEERALFYCRKNPSSSLIRYFLYAMLETPASERYVSVMHEKNLPALFRQIRNRELPRIAQYCLVTGRRKVELDKLADHLRAMDERPIGHYCLEMCPVFKMVEQLVPPTCGHDSMIQTLKYVYIKSGSDQFLPAVLSYFAAYHASSLMQRVATIGYENDHRMFTFAQLVLRELADGTEAADLIDRFCRE